MDQEVKLAKPVEKNKFKIVAIIFIVLSIVLAGAAAYLTIQHSRQSADVASLKSQVDSQSNQLSQLNQSQADKQSVKSESKSNQVSDPNKIDLEKLKAVIAEVKNRDDLNVFLNVSGQPSKIQNSSFKSYQTLWIGAGGTTAMLYRKSPTSSWQYGYDSGQQMNRCDKEVFFDRLIFQEIFANIACYDPDYSGSGAPDDPENATTFGKYFRNR